MADTKGEQSSMSKFSRDTKRVIGARAGWRCSFPGCGRVTVGPGPKNDDYAQTGSAAHIFSRSRNGPRGQGGLSARQLSATENGIWLCQHHGSVVDTKRGEKYPAELLLRFKQDHEARIAAEHEGLPVFRFSSVHAHENPVFRNDSALHLGKVTVLAGDNATGKTTVLRWIDAISPHGRMWRDDKFRETQPIHYSINLLCPKEETISVMRDSMQLRFLLNGSPVLINPHMTEVVFPDRYGPVSVLESHLAYRRREAHDDEGLSLDDVSLLAEYMDINPLLIPRLLPFVGSFVENSMENARVEVREGLRKIIVDDTKRRSENRPTSIHRISGSMASRLVLDMQIAMAKLTATLAPTALLLSLVRLHLDPGNLRKYVNLLLSPEIPFQTVLETPNPGILEQNLGWSAVRFSGSAPECQIDQIS